MLAFLGLAGSSFAQVQPPIITLQPQGQIVPPNTTVTLRVLATGTPPLRYLWRLNGISLPNETNATLLLPGLLMGDGGSYSVGVFNDFGSAKSDAAAVAVRGTTGPAPSDSFRDRVTVGDAQGFLHGDSSEATVEPGEPVVDGGGKSMWYEWVAPANGIVTFSTRGSSFDTLLSVYTGGSLSTLQLVTRGDDENGFYTSSVRFNTQARNSYQIAVDGFSFRGEGGQFTLGWGLEITTDATPVIVSNAVPVSVVPGSDAMFAVLTESTTDQFQWYRNGLPIRDATFPTLRVLRAQSADLGLYSVRVSNSFGRFVESPFASLQLGPESGPLIHDKFQALYSQPANGNRPGAGFISIGLGGIAMTNEAFSKGAAQPIDPFPCDEAFEGTLWMGLDATNTGVIQVDTTGSAITNRLAVYRLTGGADEFESPNVIACDVTSGPAGLPCITNFNATNGTNYTIVVEGYKGTGNLKLTCRMGIAPLIIAATQCVAVAAGGTLQLSMPATNWIPAPRCQWRRDGNNITDATNATLTINNFNALLGGSYSVVMSNFVRVATNTVAVAVEQGAFALGYSLATNNGNVGYVVSGAAGHAFVLERAPAADGVWTPWVTNVNPCSTLIRTNPNILLDAHRFFRAVSWPPGP